MPKKTFVVCCTEDIKTLVESDGILPKHYEKPSSRKNRILSSTNVLYYCLSALVTYVFTEPVLDMYNYLTYV